MSERPFMQLYVSDFVGDTLHLSTEQIGAYMLLLMAMWNAGGKLPASDEKLARVVRMSLKKWRAISPDLLGFFVREGETIQHNRLTKELQKSESKSQSRAAAGAKGGAAKALKDQEQRVANAMPEPQHLPDTITRVKEEPDGSSKKRGCRIPDDFVPDVEAAIEMGLSPSQAKTEAAKFRDYWTSIAGAKAVKLDWPAVWRNWVRSAVERRPQARASPPSRPQTKSDVLATLRERMRNDPRADGRRFEPDGGDVRQLPVPKRAIG